MIDNLCKEFLKNPTETNAITLLRFLRCSKEFEIGFVLCSFFIELFPYSIVIKEEAAIISYYSGHYENAYDLHDSVLQERGLSLEKVNMNLTNQHFSIYKIYDRFITYNSERVNYLVNKKPKEIPLVTLTITSCRRFDLFQNTMNSLLNCFDLENIDYFFCVDDNSSEEDREQMQKLYPFFTFYFKTEEEKGHVESMNIIRNHILETTRTPYFFHTEDDFTYYCKRNYIMDAMEILESDNKLGQLLINKNYSETADNMSLKGGDFKTTSTGLRYYLHEFCRTEEERLKWAIKHGSGLSSNYWPGFSFRPSLIKSNVIENVGEFEKVVHFEMAYAYKYLDKGYISGFFEGIYCKHTGRLTSERHDKTKDNAYTKNKVQQFHEIKEIKEAKVPDIKTYVVNLDRRPDRWETFKKNASEVEFLKYERFSAIDGKTLKSTCQLQRIFDCNDWNMNVGGIGCFLSHIALWIELIYSENCSTYFIMEDDVEFAEDFESKFLNVQKDLDDIKWDICFVGHHYRFLNEKDKYCSNELPKIEKADINKSFSISLGGTTGYLITKAGAQKMLNFINKNKAINCIDTCMQKSCNDLNVYYLTPILIYSECYRSNVKDQKLDTDIQLNYMSLTIPFEQKMIEELDFYKVNKIFIGKILINEIEITLEVLDEYLEDVLYCYINEDKLKEIENICINKKIQYYTIENKAIFILKKNNLNRYVNRFKINGKYSITDCF